MTLKPISRVVVPFLVLVGACDAVVIFGTVHIWRELPVETNAATAAAALPLARRDDGSAVLVTAQTEASGDILAVSPRSPNTHDFKPVFDIARIERTGDAVIAGKAAPGAIVELLRNDEPHDRAVADQSGQFVMVTPRLPPGDYEMTLRSRQPDG